MRCILQGCRILSEDNWIKDGGLLIEEKKIIEINDHSKKHITGIECIRFPSNYSILPGLIDLHIHGAAGADVMDASAESLQTISNALAREGVTHFLATTMTMHQDQIHAALRNIAQATNDYGVLGVHLEGPFLSANKAGAQNTKYIAAPSIQRWLDFQKSANGAIKIVTLAPELQCMDLIRQLQMEGVMIAMGHSDALFEEAEVAISQGVHYATHLFNAMRSIHQREPGISIAALNSNEVYCELIVDGHHVHPALIEMTYKLKGREKLLLVTDAIRAKCLPDGCYDLGGQAVEVTAGKAMLSHGVIAGSTLTMREAILNMVRYAKIPLIDAIYMASATPAHALGIHQRKGYLRAQYDADLCVVNEDFEVVMTMREGEIVFNQHASYHPHLRHLHERGDLTS